MVVEGALEGELDDHLGYGKHDPADRDGGNSRNGHRAKTVLTEGPGFQLRPENRNQKAAAAYRNRRHGDFPVGEGAAGRSTFCLARRG